MSEFKVIKGKVQSPWAVLVYGTAGLGKSSWASLAPKPFFLDLENGLDRIECDRSPVISTMEELTAAIQFFAASDYKTIVFDTADALEKILSTQVCKLHGKDSLADFGYGKGEVYLRGEWQKIINVILRLKGKGKNVIMTAHEQIQKLDDPMTESYDRFVLNIDKKAAPALTAAMDAVLFGRYETIVKSRDESQKNSKTRAVGTGKRVLYAVESAAWVAKNRFGLPEIVPMSSKLFDRFNGQEPKNEVN